MFVFASVLLLFVWFVWEDRDHYDYLRARSAEREREVRQWLAALEERERELEIDWEIEIDDEELSDCVPWKEEGF